MNPVFGYCKERIANLPTHQRSACFYEEQIENRGQNYDKQYASHRLQNRQNRHSCKQNCDDKHKRREYKPKVGFDEENHHAAARIMNKIFIVICFILAFVCFWYFVVFKVLPIARWNFFNYHFEEFDLFSRYVFISMMFDYSFTNLLFGINWMKKKFDVGFIPQLIYAIVAFALCISLRFVCLGTDSAWLGLYLVFISLIAPILNLFFSKRRY